MMMPPCSQPSMTLRAAYGGALWASWTAAARGGVGACRSGRQDGRLDRTTGWWSAIVVYGREPVRMRSSCEGRRLRRRWRAVVGVEYCPPLQQDAGDSEQPVGNAAQSTAIGVATCTQGDVAAAALGVVQYGHPRPVEHGLAQSALHGMAHDDDM